MKFKYIELTQGIRTKVSFSDYELASSKKWRLGRWGKKLYAVRSEMRNEVSLHRFIMGLKAEDKTDVDHINGNSLDNRRENLRLASRSQNIANQGKIKSINGKPTSCKYKGVYLSRDQKRKKKWAATITYRLKLIYLGRYETKEAAALAYNKKAIELFGNFAKINAIEDNAVL